MAWVTITEADLLTRMSGTELTELRAADLAAGQADPIASTITQAVDVVRGYVGACARNTLADGETVPDKLKGATLDIIADEIGKRLPVAFGNTEARQEAHRDAIRLLERVSECKFAISEPETADSEVIASQSPRVAAPTRNFSREAQEGI